MEDRHDAVTAGDSRVEEFPAKNPKSLGSRNLPPNMCKLVVSSLRSMSSHETTVFNLVLCGREEPLKASAAKAFSERNLLSMSELGNVSFLQLPALFGKPQEEVKRVTSSFISECDPNSVSAFIHVLPLSPPTEEDKKEFRTIKNSFRSLAKSVTMILFTVESDQTAADQDKLFKENKDIQELIESCDGQYFFLKLKEKQGFPEAWDEEKEKTMGSSSSLSEEELRMVLIGKTGSGKSTTANIILGKKAFIPKALPKIANTTCEKETGEIDGRTVAVVNTPGLYNTTLSEEEIQEELSKCFEMLAPGPHVFLLVLQIGFISQDEKDSVELIKRVFGSKSKDFIIIIFTRGGDLDDQSIEDYIKGCDNYVKKLVNDCGGRYQVFTKNDDANRTQAKELLTKVQSMVRKNGGGCYNAEMFQFTREAIQREVMRANRRHLEEMEEVKEKLKTLERDKHQQELEELRKQIQALQRDKQQNQKAEEQVEKLREDMKNLEATMHKKKGKKDCIIS